MNGMPMIEIVFANKNHVIKKVLDYQENLSVETVLKASLIIEQLPYNSIDQLDIGIYGQRCSLDTIVKENDRIEIYRPLVISPIEARKRRVQNKSK